MNVALAGVIIGAIGVVGGFIAIALAFWWHFGWLDLHFTDGISIEDESVTLTVRVGNKGGGTLHQIDLFGTAAGGFIHSDGEGTLGRYVLKPGQYEEVKFSVPRPAWADRTPDNKVAIKAKIMVVAFYGRRRKHKTIPYPVGTGFTVRGYALP